MIYLLGKVVHFEIPADDEKRAQAFYANAFGWQMNPLPGMNYTMVGTTMSDQNGVPTEAGAINGGMMKRQPPFRGPVITILVDEINSALENVQKLGGSVVRKKESIGDGNMGFTAYFNDTEGNLIGLYQNPQK